MSFGKQKVCLLIAFHTIFEMGEKEINLIATLTCSLVQLKYRLHLPNYLLLLLITKDPLYYYFKSQSSLIFSFRPLLMHKKVGV